METVDSLKLKEKLSIVKQWQEGERKYTRYSNGRLRVQIINSEPTRTDQTQAEQCDIKNIMKKYGNKIDNVPAPIGGFQGDISSIPSFQQMQDILNQGQAAFETIPAKLRKRFNNDPKEFMEFLADPTNNEEAIKLGLKIKIQPTPEPTPKNDEKNNAKPKNAKNKTSENSSTGNTDSDD